MEIVPYVVSWYWGLRLRASLGVEAARCCYLSEPSVSASELFATLHDARVAQDPREYGSALRFGSMNRKKDNFESTVA